MGALLAIDPIAFKIGSLSVHWYGLILGLGAIVGMLIAMREGKRFGLPQELFMDILLFGVPSAIICARIYYVAFQWDQYKNDPLKVFAIWEGGIAIYGALIGAVICAVIYTRIKGYSFWRIADLCAPGLLAGQLIGRWGNFVNQEAYGGETTEGFLRGTLHLPDFIVNQMNVEGIYRHPTFLYESCWNIVGIILIFIIRRRKFVRAGEIFIGYFIWYAIGRFFIEALRTDSLAFHGPSWLASLIHGMWTPMTWFGFQEGYLDPAYGNIRISQLLAIVFFVVAIVLIIVRRKNGQANIRYSDPIVSSKIQNAPAAIDEKHRVEGVSAESVPTHGRTHAPESADPASADKSDSSAPPGEDSARKE
ncbi:prolipoprotein diacylglyceryl transferase [Saccharibacillus sp. O23]|uniref:prolipoprotein diacylglyceryl transferase n=1 Tax=Saccharibacillus sp. O23 TaxID=2009338 RepID=UPI000B4E8244|nr:prolipoprotein diacylglyceryl transferase [Saccharibacillus sp. O23]OWR28561.1 prolipoprotein diacylglyceryl transferase [Saccharibacillus sp. O23]